MEAAAASCCATARAPTWSHPDLSQASWLLWGRAQKEAWCGGGSDEIVNMRIEDVTAISGKGLTCKLDQSKADRALEGLTFAHTFRPNMPLASATRAPVCKKLMASEDGFFLAGFA